MDSIDISFFYFLQLQLNLLLAFFLCHCVYLSSPLCWKRLAKEKNAVLHEMES